MSAKTLKPGQRKIPWYRRPDVHKPFKQRWQMNSYREWHKTHGLRARVDREVNDPTLIPAPLPPRPPRKQKKPSRDRAYVR